MWILVGLGNPGEEYKNTRHNIGRIVLETFKKSHEFPDFREEKSINALISDGKIGKEKVSIILPETFMNKSGLSLKGRFRSIKSSGFLVVVHDDLDLPFGRFKISFNKSAGGHLGVASIVKVLKTEAFIRVRVGISPLVKRQVKKPIGEKAVLKHILGTFKPVETVALKKISKKASEALELIIVSGYAEAANLFNRQ